MTDGSRFQRSENQATPLPAAAAATPAHMRAHAEGNNTRRGSLRFPCCQLALPSPTLLQTVKPERGIREEGIIRREMQLFRLSASKLSRAESLLAT